MKIKKTESIRRMVNILNRLGSIQFMLPVIKSHMDIIIYLLLEIIL
jgi:hypothetical protein